MFFRFPAEYHAFFFPLHPEYMPETLTLPVCSATPFFVFSSGSPLRESPGRHLLIRRIGFRSCRISGNGKKFFRAAGRAGNRGFATASRKPDLFRRERSGQGDCGGFCGNSVKKSVFFSGGELQNAQCVLCYIKSTERNRVSRGNFRAALPFLLTTTNRS